MSWSEFKKKKEQVENKIRFNTSSNDNSQLSSWEKYKQEVELTSNRQMSSWEKYKNEKENKITTTGKKDDTEKENTWFKSSELYKDNKGNVLTDTLGTIGATVGDIGVNIVKGAGGLVEGVGDLISYGVADVQDWTGHNAAAEETRTNAQKSTVDELLKPTTDYLDKYSVLGEKSDSIAEGLGYVAAITAVSVLSGGAGAALGGSSATAATIGSTAATFTSAMGNGMTEALNDGADIDEARIYGAISGAGEAVSELAFGGLGKASEAMGLSRGALDDVIAGGLTKNIKNKMLKTIVQSGIKAGGEGFEEVLSGLISAAGKKVTYMKEKEFSKIVKDENLAEQFWMGALTSAIAQGPSTIKNAKSGTDYITGRTNNEQKVYDNEVKTRTSEKIRQSTIEQAYNEQIKAKENLEIEITDKVKAETMKKVENAYNNGTLKSTELSKKDLRQIERQVDTDMQEGNISAESIMKTLGENQDISKDNLLMRSMYENEQKYNSYQVEKTDNEKVNILMQSASDAGMNNTSKTRKKVELISKLVQDTDRQYKFVSPEQLKEMGYNEKANGLIDKSTGEILINAHSDKGIQSIVGHETTHIFDSKNSKGTYSKEYQTLQDAAIEYAKTKGIYDSKIQSITEAYGDLLVDESQIKEELTADLVGDFLFNDEKFIENLAIKDRNVFQKIYDYIKHTYKMVRGTEEEKAFENLKRQFEKVYKTISTETNTDTKYSIAGEKAIEKIKNTKLYKDAEDNLKLAKQLKEAGKSNLELVKETGWFQDQAGDWKFEFSDRNMELKEINFAINKEYKLSDVLEHDELFYFYPELANYTVIFNNKTNSSHSKKYKTIYLSNYKLNNLTNLKGTLIHEIQHAIQNIENHAHGTNTKLGLMRYYNTLGEIEAEDTKQRYLNNVEGKRNTILPESGKKNPTHIKVKNGDTLVKIANGVYNFFHGGEKNVYKNKRTLEENYEGNRPLVVERGRIKYSMKESENNSGSFFNEKNIAETNQMKQYTINKPFKLADSYKIYRGVSKDGNTGTAMYGEGLYTTTNKKYASQFGDVIEIDRSQLPKNPLQFKTEIDFSQWEKELANSLGIPKNKLYNNDNVDKYAKKLGYDGITIGTGKDMTIVTFSNNKYSMTNDIFITGDDIAIKDLLVQEKNNDTIEENIAENTNNSIINKAKPSKEAKEIIDKYKLMEIGKREYEKILRIEKPTEKEKITVDRLLKGEIENNEIPASVNRQRVVDLYNAKSKFYNVENEIKEQRKGIVNGYRNLAKNMTQNISSWKDKKRGIQYQVNTMKRNLRDIIPNKSEADALYNEYFKPITKNNAIIEKEITEYNERISKYEINNTESQYAQMIGENKYNPDTKLPVEKIEDFYNKNKSKIDIKKCNEAVEEFRKIYDELIVKVNDTLIANGYKPIEYRQGYFPHFIEDKANTIVGKMAEKLGWKVNKDSLPTDIAGITDQFKPGKRWTAFSQQRKGDATDYDALKGYDNYIRGAMDVIHHTTDIQKLRALENEIRYQYSEKGIQEQIDNIYNDNESSIEEKEQKINDILDNVKNNPMGNLATELRNYTNNLANKKETSDRGMEQALGRQTYSIMANVQNRVSANMVGANIASAMTNFIPITQAWSQTSTKNMIKAIKEGIAIQFKDDGFSDNSTFLTNRTKQADRLYKTGLDKLNNKLGYMFDVVDSFTSNVIVRAKYYDNIDSGMSISEAMDNADEFAKDVMAGRSKGDMPTIFNKKNPLVKLFTAFQLEVNNQYGHMFKDIPADLGGAAKEKLVAAFVKMFLGAYLYNMLSEKITGRKSAFSPIDIALDSYNTLTNNEMSAGDKINSIATDLVGEAPFIGGIAGGGRLPIQGAIPYDNPISMVSDTISNVSDFFDGNESQKQTAINSLTKEWSKPLYYVALPFAGGQLKKTADGLSMYLNDVPGSYNNSGDLRYTVDDDVGSKVKSAIFGAYANPYAQDYIDSGYKTIKKDNIDEMVGLDMNSTEYREYKKGLNKVSKTTDENGYKQYTDDSNNVYWYDANSEVMYDSNYNKTTLTADDLTKTVKTEEALNYISSLDLTDTQKNLAANNLNKNSKKTIDMSEYSKYSSYDEYKYARDNPEKYSVVSKITDYDSYTKYKDAITDIKKQYSTELGYESKERKTAVQSYINSLDLNIYQKMMLEKMAGGYSIKDYQNYIYEYLESTDLTDSEKYTMWEELFN